MPNLNNNVNRTTGFITVLAHVIHITNVLPNIPIFSFVQIDTKVFFILSINEM